MEEIEFFATMCQYPVVKIVKPRTIWSFFKSIVHPSCVISELPLHCGKNMRVLYNADEKLEKEDGGN